MGVACTGVCVVFVCLCVCISDFLYESRYGLPRTRCGLGCQTKSRFAINSLFPPPTQQRRKADSQQRRDMHSPTTSTFANRGETFIACVLHGLFIYKTCIF